MEFLTQLWMPILVSGVLVWILSSIMHMVMPHHKPEYKGLPNEDKFFTALEGVPPGNYMFPWGTMADMKNPEFMEKMKRVPNGTLTTWTDFSMGRNLALSLLFFVVVSAFVAYIGWHALGTGVAYLAVFRLCGAAAFMGYGLGWMIHMVWYKSPGFWAYLFDAIVYALATAGVFGWLWPGKIG